MHYQSKYGKRAYGILFEVQSSDTLFVQLYDVIYISFANQNLFGNVFTARFNYRFSTSVTTEILVLDVSNTITSHPATQEYQVLVVFTKVLHGTLPMGMDLFKRVTFWEL